MNLGNAGLVFVYALGGLKIIERDPATGKTRPGIGGYALALFVAWKLRRYL